MRGETSNVRRETRIDHVSRLTSHVSLRYVLHLPFTKVNLETDPKVKPSASIKIFVFGVRITRKYFKRYIFIKKYSNAARSQEINAIIRS